MTTRTTITTFAIIFAATLALSFSGESRAERDIDPAMMDRLTDYFDTDEDGVIERLAQEAAAIDLHSAIKGLMGDSYAGAWFDETEGLLHVATTSHANAQLARKHGAAASVVSRSQSDLNQLRGSLSKTFDSRRMWGSAVRGVSIDVEANMISVRYAPDTLHFITSALDNHVGDFTAIRFEEVSEQITLSYDIRGADSYKNTDNGDTCSIGFSSTSGYFSAGHCGQQNHDVNGNNGQPQGQFGESTWPSTDLAVIDTNFSWTKLPEINGYTDGTIDVPGYWGGHLEGLVNTTVCRYGQRTDGPHCGSILERNATEDIAEYPGGPTYTLHGLIKTNACEELGDSGGPLILSSNDQAQGTLVGGYTSTCPGTSQGSYFEPIKKHMIEFNDKMLTTHGASSPTIHAIDCFNLGYGNYKCGGDVSSQGMTSGQWSASTGHQGSGPTLSGSCSSNQTVSVSLSVSNPYGNPSDNASFDCLTGPLQ